MDDSARINALQIQIAELERKLNFVLDQLKLQYTSEPLPPAQAEAARWLRQGNKIEAIKAYQKLTGGSLKDAKTEVEALEAKLSAA